jgi:penicillin-binding protein 1C
VITTMARFTPAVESPRKEFFLGTTAEPVITAVSAGGEIAHIASPANGMVIAIDPDIPESVQRVPLSARGVNDGMVLKLNGAVLGKATGKVLWSPKRGTHLLALEDASGHTLDKAHFVVR